MSIKAFTFSRNQEWFWMLMLSTYIGLVLNFPVLLRKSQVESEFGLSVIVLDMIYTILSSWALLSIAVLFGSKKMKLIGAVIIIISAVAAYYMWFFNVVIGYGIIHAIFGTELSLMAESTGYKHILFSLIFGIIPAIYFLKKPVIIKQCYITRYFWRIIFILIAVAGFNIINHHYKSYRHPLDDGRIPANPFGVAAHSYLPTNWLVASGMAASNYMKNKQLENRLLDPAERFDFKPIVNLDDVYVVFVVGESARSDRMSILGQQRETTPLLQNEKNVVAYKGTSCNTVTKLSLGCMFVRQGGVEYEGEHAEQIVKEKHIFNFLKSQGFSLELFAMQAEVGFYNTVGADSYKIREEIGAEASRDKIAIIDDYLLVEQTKKSIERHPQGGHIVMLHMKGSHFNYSSRYPRNFAKFKPECSGIDGNCSKEELYNSYDNTILFTDHILGSIIDLLRDKKALLVYTSDHGESIDEGIHFHGTPKNIAPAQQRDIPVIMWASDSFLKTPQLAWGFQAAKRHHKVKKNVQHEQIFESMLGCLGYQSRNGGIRPENNWCRYRPEYLVKMQKSANTVVK
ncbi:MAG: kdo(2)-lipid A phosphoethanolamine 7''-transferase [Magnetococcales bacterium]|nr:kdo(2)-lipid A phosphoethanolamine 7''-transferase [Magnetococcales bacterium]